MSDRTPHNLETMDEALYLKSLSKIIPVSETEQTKLAQQMSNWIDEGEGRLNRRKNFTVPIGASDGEQCVP